MIGQSPDEEFVGSVVNRLVYDSDFGDVESGHIGHATAVTAVRGLLHLHRFNTSMPSKSNEAEVISMAVNSRNANRRS